MTKEYYRKNRKRIIEKSKLWQKKNKKKVNARGGVYYRNNTDKVKSIQLKYKFGITLDDYNKIFIEQNGNCAICDRNRSKFNKNFSVDHCHKTGKIRGLLCHSCNTAIGLLQDSYVITDKATQYLKSYE